ncbi:non-ribosomal peptide synthetase [Amycolatopsis sp. cmx-11-12]|uniref:non-ribosomal peptide synthetase n=1 Tax=Amycolatopsis sp. cmx-11-12 TaxID=2785795 RepID=UPI003916FD57
MTLSTDAADAAGAFWRNELAGSEFSAVPRWAPPGARRTRVIERRRRIFPAPPIPRESFRQAVLAAHAKVLSVLVGQPAVRTGFLTDGNSTPFCLTVRPGSWADLVQAAESTAARLAPHQWYPLASIISDGGGDLVFDVVISVDPPSRPLLTTAGSTAVIGFAVHGSGDDLTITADYHAGLFDEEHVDRLISYHFTALSLLTAEPDADHDACSLLSEEELDRQTRGMNDNWVEPPPLLVHDLIEEHVRRTPDEPAVEHDGHRLSYGELNERANRLAHGLIARGVRDGAVVAVLTERDLDWAAAVLAVFKAGGTYLPIDPHYPASRIQHLLEQSGSVVVLTQPGATAELPESSPPVVLIDALTAGQDRCDDPDVVIPADQRAYIYFTSGSTGLPKGAMCAHDGMLNHLLAKRDDLGLTASDVVVQNASQCFDISLWQLVGPWLVGGRSVIVDQEWILDVAGFIDHVVAREATVLQIVPSYLDIMLSWLDEHPRPLGRLRFLGVTGEAVSRNSVARWLARYPGIPLLNGYGATEASDDTTHEIIAAVPDQDLVPVGRPNRNVRAYVMDSRSRLVPLGSVGEIVFSGVCVGLGYVNDPERTAAAFQPDPFHPGDRMYRSGDFGRWLPTGSLEFLGRRDSQVKIRGMRIELGEIENRITALPGIRAATVLVRPTPGGDKELVAMFVADDDLPAARLRARLQDTLPAHMVPAVCHQLGAMPLNDNGKVDRRALAAMADSRIPRTEHVAPATATERRLATAWAEVLGLPWDEIGARSNFFDLGGSSLSAVRLVVVLDRLISLNDLTGKPVLRDLAAAVDAQDDTNGGRVLQALSTPARTRTSVVFFTDAAGNAVNFHPLAQVLVGHDIAVYGIEPPGHDLAGTGAMVDVPALAAKAVAEILAAVDGPVVLWGQGTGAACAVAVARSLAGHGADVRHLVVGSPPSLERSWLRRHASLAEAMSDEDVRALFGAHRMFTALDELNPERVSLVGACYRHDVVSACRYLLDDRRDPRPPARVPLTVVTTVDEQDTTGHQDWRRFSTSVTVRTVAGDRYLPQRHPDAAAEIVLEVMGLSQPQTTP